MAARLGIARRGGSQSLSAIQMRDVGTVACEGCGGEGTVSRDEANSHAVYLNLLELGAALPNELASLPDNHSKQAVIEGHQRLPRAQCRPFGSVTVTYLAVFNEDVVAHIAGLLFQARHQPGG